MRHGFCFGLLVLVFASTGASAGERFAFVQLGRGVGADAATGGLVWPWPAEWPLAGGRLGGHWEVAIGRWSSDRSERRSGWVTQLGVTPTLRWRPAGGATWFVEAGIGGHLITPLYRNGAKRFSTRFNFGDHVAVGWTGLAAGRGELALRLQHFSNAGIDTPNPGEDFIQLRWSWRW